MQLPYINYLRQLGSTFLNAYTNSPICCPSRAGKWSAVELVVKSKSIGFHPLVSSQPCGAVSLFTSHSHGTTTSVWRLTPPHGWICWKRMDTSLKWWESWTLHQGVTLSGIVKLEESFIFIKRYLCNENSLNCHLLSFCNKLPLYECIHCSNRVEAWTRDVPFLLTQEGRPVSQLVGNTSTIKVMKKDWQNTDQASQWIRHRAAFSNQPFALYLGLNLPHPYKTESLGPTAGGSTFRSSPYWLSKARLLFFLDCFFFFFYCSSQISFLLVSYWFTVWLYIGVTRACLCA